MATSITGKPNKKVTNLTTPTRGNGNRTMTSSWKVPASMTKADSKTRATNLVITWKFNIGGKIRKLTKTYGTNKTSSSVNLDSFSIGNTTYTRSSFYPNTENKLASTTIAVQGKNSKGKGESATQTRKFYTPRKPVVEFITFDPTTGRCGTRITTDAGADNYERYDTYYRVTVTKANGETVVPAQNAGVIVTVDQTKTYKGEDAKTSTDFTVEYDASGYQSLTDDQHIKVEISAWSRGYAGDSLPVTQTYYVSKPKPATISNARVSSKTSTGIVTIDVDTNQTEEHPVDTVRLEYLHNVPYEKAEDIPAQLPSGYQWEDSDIEDNGDCTSMSMPIEDLVPDRGNHTWLRVRSSHANNAVLYSYSNYINIADLETPAATQIEPTITIISATSGANGESAVVQLGWNADGTDDSTGTELTWSDEEDTWKSTKDPEKFEFTWTDGRYPPTGTKQYNDSAEIVIKGLSEGTKYYVRARRYYEGETTTYGNYSNTATVLTSEKPSSVVATCNKFVTAGEPLSVYWTFSGNGIQQRWRIEDSNGTNIANGEDTFGATQISWKTLSSFATNNSITFRVWVSTGSDEKESAWRTVTIREKPTLSLNAPSSLTAQPYSFTATSSRPCDLVVIVTAQGASGQFPDGYKTQIDGDTIHSDVYPVAWQNGSATVTLPTGLDFWDLGGYMLSVVAVDRETGLRSEPQKVAFTVAWANKAKDPYNFVTLTPVDTVSEGNEHIQGVQIALTPPTGSRASDVYDIYRMDGLNANLISGDDGFPLTYTLIDEYAPFSTDGELFYRIALRTVDGDVEYADKPYTLESNTVRFDWQGGTLELPYGISIGDTYKKSVEFRQHMDGSVDGYWNPNIERTGSYSSSIIKLIQPEEINLARQLARYAGAVFVRTANGSAFTADVQVTDLSVKNEALTAIAVDATEVGMTDEFMLTSPNELGD